MAASLQRMSPKAEESGQFAAAVCAQKMLYELLLRRKLDHEAAKASRPEWGITTATPGPNPHPLLGSFSGQSLWVVRARVVRLATAIF